MDPATHYKICPRCQQPQALNAAFCTECGRQFRSTNPMPIRAERPVIEYLPPERPAAPYRAQRTDLCAVLSFAFGVTSLAICSGGFGPVALIFGIVAIYRMRDYPGTLGKGLAITGLLIGACASAWAGWNIAQALREP